jgi:signal transduction histidine kinase
MSNDSKAGMLRVWPVFIALALVGLLIGGMIVLDVRLGTRVSEVTYEITDNTQRSLVLVDGIRARAEDISRFGLSESERAGLKLELDALGRDYDPIANSEGEAVEWAHLKILIQDLVEAAVNDHAARRGLAKEIDASADRLVAINVDEGHRNATFIREAHHDAIRDDALAGGLTLAVVTVIAVVLVRVLQRQRALVATHLQSLSEKNRDLEAFAGRAAHDLRSPMSPIRGYADLLLETDRSPEAGLMARRIRTAVDRMARVVDDMLALSTAGHPPPGVSSSTEIALAVIDELGPELHSVEVTSDLGAGRVACSAGILNQLLRNLIGNALKYRDRTRPLHVTIATRDLEAMVEIAITDNGIGMDPETAAHVFEPLYRGRADREVPGHGLGLAIVERTTKALGGTCELSSTLDEGTRVVVRLPRA